MDEIKIGDIVVLHLMSGSNVIAKIVGENEGGLIVSRPCDIVPRQEAKDGPVKIGFSPFLTIAGSMPALEQCAIPYAAILLPRLAPKKLADGYVHATSGIQVASSLQGVQSSLIR